VWGGVHPSLLPEQCLNEPFVDIVCIGEGEETIVEIAQALEFHNPLHEIKGIGFKEKGNIILTQPRPQLNNLDNYTLDWSLVNLEDYFLPPYFGKKSISYITSRGCPHNCGFCYNQTFNYRKWRCHSVEHVINEIKKIRDKYEIEGIIFDDDNFFVNEERALHILNRLKKMGISCYYLDIRIDDITEGLMRKLVEFDVRSIFVGIESGSNRILRLINKGITKEIIIEKCKIISKFPEINFSPSFIIGLPTETAEEISETIKLILQISAIVPNTSINVGTYLPYPGTDLYDLAIKEGFIPPEKTEDWGRFDIRAGIMDITWLPWATKNQNKIFYLIDQYSSFLNRSLYLDGKLSSPKSIIKRILYLSAIWRLKHQFFFFPLEPFFYKYGFKDGILKLLYSQI
jgi:radical SAM superfamily enzyme YgiQ (UPF0313 family)